MNGNDLSLTHAATRPNDDAFVVALNHWLDEVKEFDGKDLLRFPWMNPELAEEEIAFMLREGLIEPMGERYQKSRGRPFKLIFLDVDGVLNSTCGGHFKDRCLTELKRIVDASNAMILLISSWKAGWEKEEKHLQDDYGNCLDQTLADYGLEIFDKSSRYSGTRTVDVLDWVLRCNAESFVVLDDEGAFYRHPLIRRYCVFPAFSTGLTKEDANKAIEILNGGIGT